MIDPNKMLASFEAQDGYIASLEARNNRQLALLRELAASKWPWPEDLRQRLAAELRPETTKDCSHNRVGQSTHVCLDCGEQVMTENTMSIMDKIVDFNENVVKRQETKNLELATAIARDIFAAGDQRHDKVQRLAFMGGKYPEAETHLGGVAEIALVGIIHHTLTEHDDRA